MEARDARSADRAAMPPGPAGPMGPARSLRRRAARPLLTASGAVLAALGAAPASAAGLAATSLPAAVHSAPGSPSIGASTEPAGSPSAPPAVSVTGGPAPADAAAITPGPYRDTIGPGQTLWYAATLDAAATADLSVTALPHPGAAAHYGDGLELRLAAAGEGDGVTCDTQLRHFGQDEGAVTLTAAVSRIVSQDRDGTCDRPGRYLLSVHRSSTAGSDRAGWPLRLLLGQEAPLPAGTVPAGARTEYGPAPTPLTGAPRDVAGGEGFDDAPRLAPGVWRDRVLPARTRFYRVHVGWGQQLTYSAQFANEPGLSQDAPGPASSVATWAYAPGRLPVADSSAARVERLYDGSPTAVGLGTVPVSWTNRWVDEGAAQSVRQAGDYWIAVGLGPGAERLAAGTAGTAVAFVLRVQVTGRELAGPQYGAPALAGSSSSSSSTGPASAVPPSGAGARTADVRAAASGGGVTGTDMLAAATGGAVALAGLGVAALARRSRARRGRGGA